MRKEFLSGILSIIKTLPWRKQALPTLREPEEVRTSEHGPRPPLPGTRIIKPGLKKVPIKYLNIALNIHHLKNCFLTDP